MLIDIMIFKLFGHVMQISSNAFLLLNIQMTILYDENSMNTENILLTK